MLSRAHRFHGHNSLRYVYQHGNTVRGPLTAIKYSTNDRRETYRVAIVVSKKVSKSAVRRNRIRRRLYESIRQIEDRIVKPYDIVITVFHEQIADIPQKELDLLVKAQFKQAGMIEKSQKESPSPSQ